MSYWLKMLKLRKYGLIHEDRFLFNLCCEQWILKTKFRTVFCSRGGPPRLTHKNEYTFIGYNINPPQGLDVLFHTAKSIVEKIFCVLFGCHLGTKLITSMAGFTSLDPRAKICCWTPKNAKHSLVPLSQMWYSLSFLLKFFDCWSAKKLDLLTQFVNSGFRE